MRWPRAGRGLGSNPRRSSLKSGDPRGGQALGFFVDNLTSIPYIRDMKIAETILLSVGIISVLVFAIAGNCYTWGTPRDFSMITRVPWYYYIILVVGLSCWVIGYAMDYRKVKKR